MSFLKKSKRLGPKAKTFQMRNSLSIFIKIEHKATLDLILERMCISPKR
jgi:hypothetical protein